MATANKELSTQDVAKMYGRGVMTVYNWRLGSSRITPLPFHTRDRGTKKAVFFKLREVRKWASLNGIQEATANNG